MYCINCGTKLPDGAKFCFECGSPVNVPSARQNTQQIKMQAEEEVQNVEQEKVIIPMHSNGLTETVKGNSKIYKSFGHGYAEKVTTFLLVTPFDIRQTIDVIYSVYRGIGRVDKISPDRCYIKGKIVNPNLMGIVFESYIAPIEEGEIGCKVITTVKSRFDYIKPKVTDEMYDYFLKELFRIEPDVDFGVSLANKAPYVIIVNEVGSNIALQTETTTVQTPNVGGMLVGNLLFGQAGAIVGGMSGKTKSTGVTRKVFSKNRIANVVFNNGRVYEGEIREGTPLYNEVMAKI